jgi:hypothetical protein
MYFLFLSTGSSLLPISNIVLHQLEGKSSKGHFYVIAGHSIEIYKSSFLVYL